ncbi:hypothetical protein [Bradyrhizobium sp. CB1015]|uniref:hypothetical protein n=1 Tax=Bradyrhizobium sp. CB1015 TaxID=2976822 RepID=UPI0021A9799E|nr:hypothetical protein [Bradyrhizobium sp. CB1015]UWU91481.1 hypothetical protein N2604_34455 [Bradyrhizobium sp. CB1015]
MDTRVLPRLQEFRRLNFNVITESHGYPAWVEITTPEQADFARRASGTEIHVPFTAEHRQNASRPAPHRWFMLANVDPIEGAIHGSIIVAAPGAGVRLRHAACHVPPTYTVGYAGANPYPDSRDEIDDLARAVGIRIEPNFAGAAIESRTPRLYELLNRYGAAKFRDGWRPETFGGLDEVATLARTSGLLDEDADFLVAEMTAYGGNAFGAEWKPREADEVLGHEGAEELRRHLDWLEATLDAKMNLTS